MRILVTGACGFVGRALCARLIERGHSVAAAVRPGMSVEGVDAFEVSDILEFEGWEEKLAGAEAVIHLAGRAHMTGADPEEDAREHERVNHQGTRRIVEAAQAAGAPRFVFISTVAVFGQGQAADYAGPGYGPADPVSPATPYGRAKRAAEEFLMASPLEWVIIRPPLVIGSQPPGNLRTLMRLIQRGLPLPLGLAKGRRSFTTIDQLCEALARAAERPEAARRILHVGSRQAVTSRQMAEALAEGMGRRPILLPAPPGLATAMLKAAGKGAMAAQLYGSFVVDPASGEEALGVDSSEDIVAALRQASRA